MHLFQSWRDVGIAAHHWSVRRTLLHSRVVDLIRYSSTPNSYVKMRLMQEFTDMFYWLIMQ
jgi:hypothetical protein